MNPTLATVRAAFAFHPLLFKAIPEAKGAPGPTKALAGLLAKRMGALADDAVAWASTQIAKADSEPEYNFSDLLDDIAKALAEAALASVTDLEDLLGVTLDATPDAAVEWARARAAEMVGKRLEAGILVDNPNARWVISEALRKSVRESIAEAVAKGWSADQLAAKIRDQFSYARAEMIARTETHLVYVHTAAQGYREMGVAYVRVVDGPGCLPDRHDDGAGAPAGDVGVVDDASEANGQIWSVDQFEEHPIAHPRCVRGAVPWEGRAA